MGHAEGEGLSRITTVVPGTDESINRLVQQLNKLIDVHEVMVHHHRAGLAFLLYDKLTIFLLMSIFEHYGVMEKHSTYLF